MKKRSIKQFGIQLLMFILAMGLCWGFYFLMRQCITNMKMNKIVLVKDNYASFFYQLDFVQDMDNHNMIGFEGVFFKLNQDAPVINEKSEISVIMVNVDNPKEKYIFKVTNRVNREDVDDYFKCNYNFLCSGFITDKRMIDTNGKVYEVFFKENMLKNETLETGLFVHDGIMERFNPKSFIEPKVERTPLENIVKDGFLMDYLPDYDVWIYQYEWKLYWITGDNFYFEEDGSTYIQYQLNTTQYDRLPWERVENGWYWSNLGDYFEQYEVYYNNLESYRVSVRELPTDYSITRIETGYYIDNEWVWRSLFRPILK